MIMDINIIIIWFPTYTNLGEYIAFNKESITEHKYVRLLNAFSIGIEKCKVDNSSKRHILTDLNDHLIEGVGCPVATHVKLCECPVIMTVVVGGVIIRGTS